MLFDGSELDVEENTRQTIEVVAEATGYGAHVEGEIESVLGRRGWRRLRRGWRGPSDRGVGEFIEQTGVYSFAPAIGTAHGLYKASARAETRAGHASWSRCTRSRWCCTAAPG